MEKIQILSSLKQWVLSLIIWGLSLSLTSCLRDEKSVRKDFTAWKIVDFLPQDAINTAQQQNKTIYYVYFPDRAHSIWIKEGFILVDKNTTLADTLKGYIVHEPIDEEEKIIE